MAEKIRSEMVFGDYEIESDSDITDDENEEGGEDRAGAGESDMKRRKVNKEKKV